MQEIKGKQKIQKKREKTKKRGSHTMKSLFSVFLRFGADCFLDDDLTALLRAAARFTVHHAEKI